MSAGDHLSPDEFLSHTELGNLTSNDFDGPVSGVRANLQREWEGYVVGGNPDEGPENYGIHDKDAEFGGPDKYIAHLRASIQKEGIREPLLLDETGSRLFEGHHRAAAALDLQLDRVPVRRHRAASQGRTDR